MKSAGFAPALVETLPRNYQVANGLAQEYGNGGGKLHGSSMETPAPCAWFGVRPVGRIHVPKAAPSGA